MGFDPRGVVTTLDWLSTPTQTLAEVTAGAVFHNGLDELLAARSRLSWYPDQVWRYILASQWQRISQEEAFVGRCGETGDDLGSAVVTARLVRDIMHLTLLLSRRYPPYAKWLGSAFAQLPPAATISPALAAAVAATTWRQREAALATAYSALATMHNTQGLTEQLDPSTSLYYDRPFRVLHAERFSQALLASLTQPDLRDLSPTGAVDQFTDNTDVLGNRAALRTMTAALSAPRPVLET